MHDVFVLSSLGFSVHLDDFGGPLKRSPTNLALRLIPPTLTTLIILRENAVPVGQGTNLFCCALFGCIINILPLLKKAYSSVICFFGLFCKYNC